MTSITRYRILLGFLGGGLFIWWAHPARRVSVMFAGLLLSLAGLCLRAWAGGCLNKSKTLANTGPYAYIRHPLYTGSFLITIGFGIAGSSRNYPIHMLLVWLVIFWVFGIVYLKKVKEEEKTLAATFGRDYLDYMARVPRFMPYRHRGTKAQVVADFSLRNIEERKLILKDESPKGRECFASSASPPELAATEKCSWEKYIKNKEYQAGLGWLAVTSILFIKRFFVLLVTATFLSLAYAADSSNSGSAGFVWRKVENHAFAPEESLKYVIKYGLINAGTATLEVSENPQQASPNPVFPARPIWKISSRAETNKVLDVIFKVRDINESWIDIGSLCSLRFEQHLREGFHKTDTVTEYDQVKGRFTMTKLRKGKETHTEGIIPPFVHDTLSSLYYIRTQNLEVGQTYTLQANSGSKNWPLAVKVQKREKRKVPAGKFDCFKLEPILAGEGIFQQEGRLEVWVTADERKIPVLLRSKVMVGAFDAELESYNIPELTQVIH